MKRWTLINPSDAYTFEAPDLEVATAAVVLLSAGFGATEIDGTDEVPILAFGTHQQTDDWSRSQFGTDFETWAKRVTTERREEIAAALDSFMIGDSADRKSYEKGFELIPDAAGREKWRRHWHDERRSSMNDIGRAAWAHADSIRRAKDTRSS